jgi:hypothetical protein
MRPSFIVAMLLSSALAWGEPPDSAPKDTPKAAPESDAAAAAPAAEAAQEAPVEAAPRKDRGAFLIGAKVGLALPFDGLGPMAGGVIEIGYLLPALKRSLAVTVDVGYTQPAKDGTTMGDPRVTGQMGTYSWHITQQELTLSAAVYYRLSFFGRAVPFIGCGPRLYLHKSTVQGSVGTTAIQPTTEQLTKLGIMIPVGVAVRLGPGELVAELLFEYGRVDDVATGWASTAGGNLQLGYRCTL